MVRRVDFFRDVMNAFDARERCELEAALNRHLKRIDTLLDVIGDPPWDRRWLEQAIADHFAGRPVQPRADARFLNDDDGNCKQG